jgi:hypothetical protein
MFRFKLSLAILFFGVQFVLPSRCIAGSSENAGESAIQTGMENSSQASTRAYNESSISNGNEADTHQQSMAAFEAGSESGASFFSVTVPDFAVPAVPSGLPPEAISRPRSNYVSQSPSPSNYIISGSLDSTLSATKSSALPKAQVWTANKARYKSAKQGNEMLASKELPKETEAQPAEQLAAPVQYYQLSATDYTVPPVWAGYGESPEASAFNHD